MSPTAYPLPEVLTLTLVILFATETIVKIAPEPLPEEVVVMPASAIASIGSDPVVVEVFNELGVIFNPVPAPFTNNNPSVVILPFTLLLLPLPLPLPCVVAVPELIMEARPLIAPTGIPVSYTHLTLPTKA